MTLCLLDFSVIVQMIVRRVTLRVLYNKGGSLLVTSEGVDATPLAPFLAVYAPFSYADLFAADWSLITRGL